MTASRQCKHSTVLSVASVRELVADISHYDTQLKATRKRLLEAVYASGTTLTAIRGCGPVVAALILGHTGDVTRFESTAHFASYNATAPIEASSGERKRHRLNQRGNRQLNFALHIIAVSQLRYPCPGRVYCDRKRAEGKNTKEALRALKRQISDVVYPSWSLTRNVCGWAREDTQERLQIQRDRPSILTSRLFG